MQSITTSQVLFLIVLGAIALGIMAFGLYVVSTSMWGVTQRWQARKRVRRY
ncbi:MAG: hypothetical protein K1X95_13135 [Acidimicrobiia bacterium]|nr:hypothetical protein [Acidimicrobiia bacterium]